MKNISRKVTTFLLAVATALSLCLAIVCMNPGKVSATDLSGNLATNAENWQVTGDGVTIDENGIKISNSANAAKAVALKTKINGEATITVKFKASENLKGFQIMFKDTRDTVPTAVGYNQGGDGHRLLVDLRRIGDYVANYSVLHYQDGGQPFPNWPGEFVVASNAPASADGKYYNEFFDGNEYSITIKTVDTEEGAVISVNVGDKQLLSEEVISDTAIIGEQYITLGCFEADAESEVTFTSVTVKVPEPPAEKDFTGNVALKENQWVKTGSKVSFTEEGIRLASDTDDNSLNLASVANKIGANAKITLKFRATGEMGNFFIQFKDTGSTAPTEVGYSGNRIVIQMRRTAGFHPNYFIQSVENNGGPNYGGAGDMFLTNEADNKNSMFDGTEHTVVLETADTENGIKISVSLDAIDCKINGKVIESESLKGEQYLTFGVQGFNANTEFIMTSVTIEEKSSEPETPAEIELPEIATEDNIVSSASGWTPVKEGITMDENGLDVPAGKSIGASFVDRITANSTINMYLQGQGSTSKSHIFLVFKDNSDLRNGNSSVQYGAKAGSRRIAMEMIDGSIFFWDYTMTEKVEDWGKGAKQLGSLNNKWLLDGKLHLITVVTEDLENGISFTVSIDGVSVFSKEINDAPELKGDYDLTIKVQADNDNDIKIPVLTATGAKAVIKEPVVLPEIEEEDNLLIDGYAWVPNKDGVTFDDNGLTVPAGKSIGTSYKNRITADSTIDMYFQGTGAQNGSHIYLVFKDNSNLREGQSSVQYGAVAGSRRIAIEMTGGAVYFWDYTMTEKVEDWTKKAVQLGSSSVWYLDGELHRLTVVTNDTDNGIKFTVSIDNTVIFSKEIENAPELKGDYDLTIKVQADEQNDIKIPVLTATGATALHKQPFVKPEYDKDKYNLATDYYSWVSGNGVSIGKVDMDDNGITFSNTANSHAAAAALKTTRVKDYKVSMLFNSSLNPPTAEESGDSWRYSYVELVCKTEMSSCTSSIACPYGGGTCYYSFRMGWESQRNSEGNTCFGIFKHRGYSTGTPISFVTNRTDININDGEDHWLEMTVRDVTNDEGVSGMNIIISLDGELIFDYVDYDRVVTEEVTVGDETISVDYDWKISGMNGWIGLACYSDYLETIPAEDKHNSFLLKEYYVTMYDDDNPGGVMLERAKVETPDPTPGEYEDPEVGRDPENNQTGGIDITFDEGNTAGCNSSVSANSMVITLPLIIALAIVIIAKKRRKE